MNKVTNLTLPSGETVEIQDSHAITLDENIDINGIVDFNKVTGYGNYNVSLNALNQPAGVSVTSGVLKVIYDHDKPVQFYINRISNKVYMRSLFDNGNWGEWIDLTGVQTALDSIAEVDSKVTDETANRILADDSLSSTIRSVSNELATLKSSTSSSIENLTTKIDDETSTREEKDASIQTSVNNINATVASHTSSINSLNSKFVDRYDKLWGACARFDASLFTSTSWTSGNSFRCEVKTSRVSGTNTLNGILHIWGLITLVAVSAQGEYRTTWARNTYTGNDGKTYSFSTNYGAYTLNSYGNNKIGKLLCDASNGPVKFYSSGTLDATNWECDMMLPVTITKQ